MSAQDFRTLWINPIARSIMFTRLEGFSLEKDECWYQAFAVLYEVYTKEVSSSLRSFFPSLNEPCPLSRPDSSTFTLTGR